MENWINFTHRCLRWCPLYVVSSWPPAEREIKWNAFFCRSLSYECFMWCIFILVWSISATTCCFPLWLKMIFWIAMMYPNLHCQWCMCVFNICHSYHATASEQGRGHTWKKKISTMRNVGIILISYVLHFDLASHKF